MQNSTQFQTLPGFGNFGSNTGTATVFPWGETTGYGYGYPFTGMTPYGVNSGLSHLGGFPLMQAIEGGLGLNSQIAGLGLSSGLVNGHGLVQTLFSETGLVLGPINGGMNSFFGNGFGAGQSGAITSLITLAQGVASAQTIAHSGISTGQNLTGNVSTQGLGSAFLTSLIRVRYYDNNSTFVIGCDVAGGNSKNINVTVVGEEIRIWKIENGSAAKNVVNASNFGKTGAYYSLPPPFSADSKAITAIVKDGILTITLQKAKEISKNVHQVTVK